MAISGLKLAVAQYATGNSLEHSLDILEYVVDEARTRGVHLILFPEAFLGGYPRTCSFGSVVGSRSEEGREQYYKYWKQCVDLGDSCPDGAGVYKAGAGDGTREKLELIAKNSGIFIVVGIVEKCGGSLYCGCLFIDPVKGLVGKRRKVMPVNLLPKTGTERVVWGIGSPKTLKAIEATIAGQKVTLGAAICWENYMPLLRASLYTQGVSIYLAPTADARESWLSTIRHIAMEGRCFVLSCNQYLTSENLPNYTEGYNKKENTSSSSSGGGVQKYVEVSAGGSVIVGPMGNIIAGPLWGKEGVLEMDVGDVERTVVSSKLDFDVGMAGHYGRSDVFKLSVEGLDLGSKVNVPPS